MLIIVAPTFNKSEEIFCGNLVRQRKTIKFDMKGEQTPALYKVYQNQLNRLKRVKNCIASNHSPYFLKLSK